MTSTPKTSPAGSTGAGRAPEREAVERMAARPSSPARVPASPDGAADEAGAILERAAGDRAPAGPARGPGPATHPAGPGTTSPRSSAANGPAAGEPSPATGAARPCGEAAPGRGRTLSPAGTAADAQTADGAVPAGSSQIAAMMSEAQLEEHVRALCKGLGILRFHVRNSRGMDRGWPDDVLIGSRGVLWRECKTQRGKVTPEQRKVGEALTALGQDYAVWRPGHLLTGVIAGELAALAGVPVGGRGNHPAGRRLPPEGPGGGAAA